MNHLLHKLIATGKRQKDNKQNSNKGPDIHTETSIITSARIKLIIRNIRLHTSDIRPTELLS